MCQKWCQTTRLRKKFREAPQKKTTIKPKSSVVIVDVKAFSSLGKVAKVSTMEPMA